jgi:hypothetical protein
MSQAELCVEGGETKKRYNTKGLISLKKATTGNNRMRRQQ